MKDSTQIFTYTSHRQAYLSIVLSFLSIMLLESSLLVLLILVLARSPLLKFALLGAYAGFMLFLIFRILLSALWTKHRLTRTQLMLRYGRDTITIPRTAIVDARPVHEKLSGFQLIRGQLDRKRHRIVVAFSEYGQVLLSLDKMYRFRVNGTTGLADHILINVDNRDEFLTALGLSQTPVSSATSTLPIFDNKQARMVESQDAIPSRSTLAIPPMTPSTPSAIRTEGLSRRYNDRLAVDNLNLNIRPGEVYGFLGPNGAGKTTTMNMLVGLLQPNTGRAFVADYDVWAEPIKAKAAYGFVPDRAVLYERLTGREFLSFLAQIRALSEQEADKCIQYLLDLLELTEQADALCSTYSFGMKRKLALAGALLHRPAVLILDEPLNGLDPRSAKRLKNLFAELANAGSAIFLSTHDLSTAEAVCHRVGILNRGRLVAEGSALELRQIAAAPDLEAVFLNLTEEQKETEVI